MNHIAHQQQHPVHHSINQQHPPHQQQRDAITNRTNMNSFTSSKPTRKASSQVRGLEDLFDDVCRLDQSSKGDSSHGGGGKSFGTASVANGNILEPGNNKDEYSARRQKQNQQYRPAQDDPERDDSVAADDDYDDDGEITRDESYGDDEYDYDGEVGDYKVGRSSLLSPSSSPVSCFDLDLVLILEGNGHQLVDVSNLVAENERSAGILRQRLEDLQQAQKSLLASRSSGLSTVLESPYSLESSTDENNYYSEEDDGRGFSDDDDDDASIFYPLGELEEMAALPDSIVERYFRSRPTVRSSNLNRMQQDDVPVVEQKQGHYRHQQQPLQQHRTVSSSHHGDNIRPGIQSVSNPSGSTMSREEMKMRQMDSLAASRISMEARSNQLEPNLAAPPPTSGIKPGAQAVQNNNGNSREDLKMRQLDAYRSSQKSHACGNTTGKGSGSSDTNLPSDHLLQEREQAALAKQKPVGPPATRPGAQAISGSANHVEEEMKLRQMDALREQRHRGVGGSGMSNSASVQPGALAVSGRSTREDFKQRELQAVREQRRIDTVESNINSSSKPGVQAVCGRPTREDFKQRELEAFREEQANRKTTTTINTPTATSASIMSRQQREEIKLREIAGFQQQRAAVSQGPPSTVRRQSSFDEVEPRYDACNTNAANFHKSFEEIEIPTALGSNLRPGGRSMLAQDPPFEDSQILPRNPEQRSRSPTSSLAAHRRSFEVDEFCRRPSFEQQPLRSSFEMQQQQHHFDSRQQVQRPHMNHADSARSYFSNSSNESQRKLTARRQDSFRKMQPNGRLLERENSLPDSRMPIRGSSESSFRIGGGSYQVPPRHNNVNSNIRYAGMDGSSFRSQGSYEQSPYGRGGGGPGQWVEYGYGDQQQDYYDLPPPNQQRYQAPIPPPHQRYQPPPPPPQPANEGLQIEIEPGFFAELRGAEETMAAIAVGRVASVECLCCSLALQCIVDAEYVLCPDCKVVSPIFNEAPNRGGVGLGLRATSTNNSRSGNTSQQRNQQDQYYQPQQHPQNFQDYSGDGRYY